MKISFLSKSLILSAALLLTSNAYASKDAGLARAEAKRAEATQRAEEGKAIGEEKRAAAAAAVLCIEEVRTDFVDSVKAGNVPSGEELSAALRECSAGLR